MTRLPILVGDYLQRFGPVLRRFRDMLDGTHAEVFAWAESSAWLDVLADMLECICALARGVRATGDIAIVNPTVTACDGYNAGDGFTISDGVVVVSFEFGVAGCVDPGSIPVSIAGDPLVNLAAAINSSWLSITATVVDGVLHLENDTPGEQGNVLIQYTEWVEATYLVVGMGGGLRSLLWSALPGNQVVELTLANTEYMVTLPSNAGYEFRARGNVALRYAFQAGRVAAPVDPYLTLAAGEQYHALTALGPHMLYLASATAGTVVELVVYEV